MYLQVKLRYTPERFELYIVYKMRYINTLPFRFPYCCGGLSFFYHKFHCSINPLVNSWELHSGSTSSWPSLHTDVYVDWHVPISLMNSTWQWTLTLVIVYDQPRRHHCSSVTHISTVGDRVFPVAGARTWNQGAGIFIVSLELPNPSCRLPQTHTSDYSSFYGLTSMSRLRQLQNIL